MNLIVNGVVSNQTSYGITCINTIIALEKAGVNVEAIPIGGRADWYEEQPLREATNRGAKFSRNVPCVRLYHEFDLAPHYGCGVHIGFPIFEKTLFSEQEIHQLNSVDLLFVCSHWAMRMIVENGVTTPIRVVNLGVDTDTFKPTEPVQNAPYRFFFPGKYEVRKGFDVLTEVFENAFHYSDNFELILLPENKFIGQQNQEWYNYIMSSKLAGKIKIINRLEHHSQVAQLYQQSDCVVSFSRAEGWNLPLLEGLACGRSIIATNYSAHTEFLNSDNSTLVDINELEPAIDGVFFHNPNNQWASLTKTVKDQLTEALRHHYKKGKGINENGVKTAQKFTWANTANQIIQHVEH